MSEPSSTSSLRRLWRYADRDRASIRWAAAFSVLNKIFDLAPPALIGAAVDIVVNGEQSLFARLGLVDVFDQLVALAALTVLVWALESIFQYALDRGWRELAQSIEHRLRVDAYDHIQSLELAFFHERSAGGLMAILNDDINQLERFLDGGANDLIQVTTTAIVITAAFFVLAPSVAWMAMLPVPFVLIGSFRFQRALTPRYAAVREAVGRLSGRLANNLGGIATIKSYATEAYESERVGQASEEYRGANRGAIRLSAAFGPLIRMVIVVGFCATLVRGGQLALSGELAVGTYSVLVFLTQRLLWPLTRLGRTFDLYQRAMASARRVFDLLDTERQIELGSERLDPSEVRGRIAFEEVRFSYGPGAPVFDGLDLEIEPGSTVGIVGSTGAGKSTLVHLLLRFYAPQSGRITIDGRDVADLAPASIRRAIALVSQSSFLFAGSVERNIVYGTPGAGRAEAERAARAAEAWDFIERMPGALSAPIGERGETLSGGQRQRISIARALVKAAPILILDEATSAVDNETEAALQRSLERASRGRTTIVIAHRLSTVRAADQIFVLEAGRVAERGTHDELVAAGRLYAGLWRVQTGERALTIHSARR